MKRCWWILLFAVLASARARAEDLPHGVHAPANRFPSHVFRLAAHQPEHVQLAFNYGLIQPILMRGFNAAVDVRYKRLVLTYSHGQGLDATRYETAAEKAAHLKVLEPWSTGGGVGILLIDELWILTDFKVHHVDVRTSVDAHVYTNVTVGCELGWRFFLWKGLNIGLVARFWPNVYSSAGHGVRVREASGESIFHKPLKQGFEGAFANVLLGWAFEP